MRYVTKESIIGLVSKLGLPEPGPYSQDWEYEIADATRVSEWIGEYLRRNDLTDDERFTLMILIIESFDDALREGISNDCDWDKIEAALMMNHTLHRTTLEYWSCPTEEDPDNVSYVTPRIRKIVAKLRADGKP